MVRLHIGGRQSGAQVSTVARSRFRPIDCRMRPDGPPAFHGIDRGAGSTQGFSWHARGVGVALSVSVPVMSSTPKGQVPRLRTAAERERHDVVYLQPIAGAAAPPAVPVDIAATTLVAPPHLPLGVGRQMHKMPLLSGERSG